MIEYIAEYNNEDRPYICKKFVASSSEEVHTSININNTQERDTLSAELIYTHMDNVIKYITKTSETVQMIQLDENTGLEPWPLKRWAEIEWAKEECILWWQYIYFKDNPTRASEIVVPVDEESIVHTHEGDEDHTHDPETGEEIPNA
jgi:hypothetical protein